jgi:two-component system cell cycle sensor histidine kinase PleC
VFGPIGAPRYLEYLNDIHTSAQSLLTLINDILDTAKIDSGKMELFEEAVDLEGQVNSALRIVAPRALSAGVHLKAELSPDLDHLYADRRAIGQILLNLLSNGVKFSPDGTVTVMARRQSGGQTVLVVADTGIGMSAAEIEIALSPFGQIANVHTRVHDGSGLGLPIVKSLAGLHGAEFSIVSAPGVGTTVTIVFPPSRTLSGRQRAHERFAPTPEPDIQTGRLLRLA